MEKQTGQCLCGEIRYSFTDEPIAAAHCHCLDCQKATGCGFATVFGLAGQDVELFGQESLGEFTLKARSGLSVTRLFCQNCGSPMFTKAENNPDFIWIKAGSLDQSDWLKPTDSCWTGSAVIWAQADPTTTHHRGNPE
ncbi:MAG: aldehyde-activating protein [Pseudomonadales bacterium]|nr:aldehyde-activating protein [Pseudomonadales bacterium]